MKKIVTIDGPSASGKSTVARWLAKRLGFEHLDTGAIYRSVAWWCKSKHVPIEDRDALLKALDSFRYSVEKVDGQKRHFVNGKDITDEIRREEISQLSSKIAVIPEVREVANGVQRQIAENFDIVVEGRDAGTVVFPYADFKVFLTAEMRERARRRMEELKERYPDLAPTDVESVIKEIQERDERDIHRDISPLKRPLDALSIDTTKLSPEQITKTIEKEVRKEVLKKPSAFWVWMTNDELAKAPALYNWVRYITFCLYRVLYRVKAYGLEHYPKGRAIIAPNHISNLDPPAVGVTAPAPLHSMAKQELFKVPFLKWLLPKVLSHPVSGTAYDTGVIKLVVSLLRKGRQVLIFPEGSRSFDGKLAPLKRGVAVLASMAEAPVVPTYIEGPHKIWPRGKRFPKLWGKISVVYGKPLYWESYKSRFSTKREAEEELIKDLEAAIRDLKLNFHRN